MKAKPLKAATMFVAFAVGGVALKGLGSAAKTLGAGAKTAKAANLINNGAMGVYVLASGAKVVTAEDAREAGFRTGDIIFNELHPAGMGLKFGVKVVERIPKGATLLKSTPGMIQKTVSVEIPKTIKTEISK